MEDISLLEMILGTGGIVVSVLFVAGIAWSEGVLKTWMIYVVFSIGATILFVLYMSNLKEWQMGLFGILSALALVGISKLLPDEKSKRKLSVPARTALNELMDETEDAMIEGMKKGKDTDRGY